MKTSSTVRPTAHLVPLPVTTVLREASVRVWYELDRCLAAGAIFLATTIPAAVAALARQSALAALLLALPLASAPGLALFAHRVVRGERPRLRLLLHHDVLLSGSLLGSALLSGWMLPRGGASTAVGCLLAALLLVSAPYALAYGAVRGFRGARVWRAAAVLVALRPSWALGLLAIGCLGWFAVAASGGVLALLVPVWVLALGASLVTSLPDEKWAPP